MPTYRIILEPGQKDAPHRRPRGEGSPLHSPERPETMTLMATDLAEAVALSTKPQSRIISVEEIEPIIQLDDDQLLEKLSQDEWFTLMNLSAEPLIGTFDPEKIAEELSEVVAEDIAKSLSDETPTSTTEFQGVINDVINALRNTGVIPGLTYSLQMEVDCAYIVLKLFDHAAGRYISAYQDITKLIEDPTAQGEAAALSIARAIISAVNLHLR